MVESKSERIERLKRLIDETKQKISLKNSSLDELSKNLSSKEEEIELAKKKLLKFELPKILSKKQLKELRENKIKEEKSVAEERKANIFSKTKLEFERALKIRREACEKSAQEKKEAELKAFKIETDALTREIEILKEVLNEKNKAFEDLLAQNVCNLYFLKKNNFGKNQDLKFLSKAKKEIAEIESKISSSIGKLSSMQKI